MKNKKVYVSMTDKFMSGWGQSRGKKNKLVFVCNSYEEAEIVERNAEKRNDMSYINICLNKPRYSEKKFSVQFKTKKDYPKWYKKGITW